MPVVSEKTDVVLYLFTTFNDVPMMVGRTGQYVREFKNALTFADPLVALEYVDKHGLNGMVSLRLFKKI